MLLAVVCMCYVAAHLALVKVINGIFVFGLEQVASLASAVAVESGFQAVFFLFHQGPLLVFFRSSRNGNGTLLMLIFVSTNFLKIL